MCDRVRISLCSLLLVGIAVSLGCANARPAPRAENPIDVYRVGPPDVLEITVLPEPTLKQTVVVRPDGMISFDLIGDVPAAGRTIEEIGADIEKRISRYKRDAKVTVYLRRAASTAITILGEVGAQATFPLPRETRLIEAIGAVGGWTLMGAASRVRIIRTAGGEPQVFYADLDAITHGDLRTNYVLTGGDIIVVPMTVPAAIGRTIQQIFFPFQQLFGLGRTAGSTALAVQTGGASLGASAVLGAP